MGRREMREHIFKLLFMQEFNTPEEMPEQVQLYFETLEELSPAEEAYMQDKYAKILEQQDAIDEELNQISSGWKVSRSRRSVQRECPSGAGLHAISMIRASALFYPEKQTLGLWVRKPVSMRIRKVPMMLLSTSPN